MTSVAIQSLRARRPWSPPAGAVMMLGAVAALLCVFAVAVVVATASRDQVDRAVLEGLIVGVPVGVGLYATRSAHTARFGVLLVCAGCVWSLTALAETSQSLPYSIGRISGWLVLPVLMYLMLAFPAGRLQRGRDGVLYGAIAALIGLLYVGSAPFVEAYPTQTPWATCQSDCPPNAFLVVGSQPAVMADLVLPLREALGVLLAVGVAASLMLRYREASVLHRRTVGPVILMSVVFCLLLSGYLVARWFAPGADAVTTLGRLWSLSVPGVAAAFFVGLVWRRLAIGEVLASLSAGLSGELDAPRMRTALAAALRDPEVDLLLPDAVPGRWRGSDGRLTSPAAAACGQTVTPLLHDGVPIAALVHDCGLDDNAELVDAVGALLSTALRHQRLTDRLATSLEQLEDSRKRIARAADVERSRIERDLHDGAQQRLIALRIRLSLAEDLLGSDPAAASEALHELGGEIELALEEVRSLAHGLYPPLLNDRGLPDALRSVLAQAPLRGHLRAGGITRHCRETETAVYFACREAIQNAIKHAPGATGVWVSLEQNHALRFEVRDDGPGFLPPPVQRNGGLRNMRDRVETVGGSLTIDSAPGRGTRIRGSVPLR